MCYCQSNLAHKNVSKNIYRIEQYLGADLATASADVGASAPLISTSSPDLYLNLLSLTIIIT